MLTITVISKKLIPFTENRNITCSSFLESDLFFIFRFLGCFPIIISVNRHKVNNKNLKFKWLFSEKMLLFYSLYCLDNNIYCPIV